MSRISILPVSVSNQIAAGEVIERPASIVKELVENSIDAGAGRIAVEVRGAGRVLVQVVDDGEGMGPDDARLSFQRHATSKLSDSADLAAVRTLGFRGEALASIASVSRVRLETQTRERDVGTALDIVAGEIVSVREDAFPPGTRVSVQDVFFNVPARRKFLKSESYELSQVTSHCMHHALAFPSIHFSLKSSGYEVFSAPPAKDARERVLQVFGRELLDELIEFERDLSGARVRIHLFTSRPHVQKHNRNSMFLFVNGRAVKDRAIMHAYTEAYRNILPSGTFPVTILFLETHPADVDVNVHPRKAEVRFRKGSLVHDAVRETVIQALGSDKTVIPLRDDRAASTSGEPSFPGRVPDSWESGTIATDPVDVGSAWPLPAEGRTLDLDFREQTATSGQGLGVAPAFDVIRAEIRPLGQLQDSFVVAVDRSGLVLIDQHVAHERILFEDYVRARLAQEVEVQRLLTPILLELSPSQEVLLESIAPELGRSGFEIEPFGPRTVAVRTAPAILRAGAVEKLLRELADGIEREKQDLNIDSFQRRIAATVACHAAIKINNPLDDVKMRWLVRELMKTDCPTVCPHGRPIIVRYDLREIHKAFKRA